MTKMRLAVVGLVVAAVLATVGLTSAVSAKPGRHEQHPKVSHSELVFHDAMRKLWEDHVTWTRMFIVEAAADSPATDASATRLLANQDDIGDAIKPFYGEAAGDQLTALLKDHILIAADILNAAKAGDQDSVAEHAERWYANADEIADFLAAANPQAWPAEEMRTMMREHLDLTLEEAVARLNGDFEADIAAYDTLHQQILHMADMLSDGIVAQFPDTFR